MVQVELKPEGIEEVGEFVATVAGELRLLVQARGLFALSSLVGREARRTTRFRDRSGLLRKSIGWRRKSTTITVPIVLKNGRIVDRRRRVNANAVVYTWGPGGSRSRLGKGARYGYVVEAGHRGARTGKRVRGRHYLRGAVEKLRPQLGALFIAKAREEIANIRSELAGERDMRKITQKLLVARRTRLARFN